MRLASTASARHGRHSVPVERPRMRYVFFILLLAGLTLGIAYPFAAQNFSGREVGRYPAYDRAGGYRPVTVPLTPDDAPLRVMVDMTSMGNLALNGAQTALTLTVSNRGRTVLASSLTFAHQESRSDNPQSGGTIYRDSAGMIDRLEGGSYVFTLGPGDADSIEIRSASLVLRAGGLVIDERAVPIGYTLMSIGFVGFVMSFRNRRRRPDAEPAPPPPPKWGRDGA